jgi:Metallo-peptidase family M12
MRNRKLLGVLALAAVVGCSASEKSVTGPGPTGALAVQVGGLPGATGARVTVTGPTGADMAVTGSTVLTGLAAGDYTVAALYVDAQSQTWTPQVSAGTVSVLPGDTASVLVTYSGGPATTLDLTIAGIQLIQSTQRADGSVPMVGGRDAMLRVFAGANQANSARPSVRIRLFQGAVQVDSFSVPAPGGSVPLTADTASLAASWNVLIPGARMLPGLSLQAEIDPEDAYPETDEGDNTWPGGSAREAVTVQNVPAFDLTFVPVKQSVNSLTGSVNGSNKAALADVTERMHPLGVVNVTVHSTYTTSAPALQSNDGNGGWGQILSEIYALRAADHASADYVGIVPATYGSGIAGLGYVGAPAAIAWDKASSAPGVIAHELGHNFGRQHAPCGNPSGPDPQYPYADASIGTWGLDLPALSLKAPGTYKDLMSYCNPDWISDYNYVAVLSFRGIAPAVASRADQPATADGEGLLVWGRIVHGNVILEPAFVVRAPATLPAEGGPHRVEGFDAAGGRVFSIGFAGEEVADLPHGDERHFAFVLPLGATDRARLTTLRLTGEGLTAIQRSSPVRSAVPAPGSAPIRVARQGGELEVRWDQAYPMALVRDARTGAILSFARGGLGRVAATGPVRVELLQGITPEPGVTLVVP